MIADTVYIKPKHCCYMDDVTGFMCENLATTWIGTDGIDNYTHSCDEHVDKLKEPGDTIRPLITH